MRYEKLKGKYREVQHLPDTALSVLDYSRELGISKPLYVILLHDKD